MIYLFRIGEWLKLGWSWDPWRRAVLGWTANVHPPDLCHYLHFEHAELVGTWGCSEESVEKAIHKALPNGIGEFYPIAMLDELLAKVANLDRLQPPPRPTAEAARLIRSARARAEITRPCCGGTSCVCPECGKVLVSWKQLGKHRLTHRAPQHMCHCGKAFRRSDQLLVHRRSH